jgi:hypothetical protein
VGIKISEMNFDTKIIKIGLVEPMLGLFKINFGSVNRPVVFLSINRFDDIQANFNNLSLKIHLSD